MKECATWCFTSTQPPLPFSLFFKRLSKLLEKSHDRTKQESMSECGVSMWVAVSKQKRVGGRKERGAQKFST